jgi:hypothetical protein
LGLFFSVGTVFFSHNKSANSTFSYGFSAKRTGQYCHKQPPFLKKNIATDLRGGRTESEQYSPCPIKNDVFYFWSTCLTISLIQFFLQIIK